MLDGEVEREDSGAADTVAECSILVCLRSVGIANDDLGLHLWDGICNKEWVCSQSGHFSYVLLKMFSHLWVWKLFWVPLNGQELHVNTEVVLARVFLQTAI